MWFEGESADELAAKVVAWYAANGAEVKCKVQAESEYCQGPYGGRTRYTLKFSEVTDRRYINCPRASATVSVQYIGYDVAAMYASDLVEVMLENPIKDQYGCSINACDWKECEHRR